MDTLSYKSISLNAATVNKQWFVVDAANMVVGRLSSHIATVLRGKHKPGFTPHVDCGDNVIIINAEKVKFTGKKMVEKDYISYTGYPGGQRFTTPKKLLEKHPERILENAIHGMLPKNKLGAKIKGNLFVYAGGVHPHEAQKPKDLKFDI